VLAEVVAEPEPPAKPARRTRRKVAEAAPAPMLEEAAVPPPPNGVVDVPSGTPGNGKPATKPRRARTTTRAKSE
jgi:hypothetical protein